MATLSLNPYKIFWAFLVPNSGKVTKRDVNVIQKTVTCVSNSEDFITIHAPSKEKIEEKISAITGKPAKTYTVYLMTDKQFGMIKNEVVAGKIKSDFMAVLTTMQKEHYLMV